MRGFVDQISSNIVSGWVFDPQATLHRIQVRIILGDKVLAEGIANRPRPDVGRKLGIEGSQRLSLHRPRPFRRGRCPPRGRGAVPSRKPLEARPEAAGPAGRAAAGLRRAGAGHGRGDQPSRRAQPRAPSGPGPVRDRPPEPATAGATARLRRPLAGDRHQLRAPRSERRWTATATSSPCSGETTTTPSGSSSIRSASIFLEPGRGGRRDRGRSVISSPTTPCAPCSSSASTPTCGGSPSSLRPSPAGSSISARRPRSLPPSTSGAFPAFSRQARSRGVTPATDQGQAPSDTIRTSSGRAAPTLGVEFLSAATGGDSMPTGFLKPEYWNQDPTHGERAPTAALLLKQIEERLAA